MELAEIEQKRDKTRKLWSVLGIGAVGLLVSPIIFMTIQGLIGLAIAGAVGFVLVSFAPVFAEKVANAKYRALEAERIAHLKKVEQSATENPIETLTNLLMQKKQAFNTFKISVEQAVTARDNFKTKVTKFTEKYPHRAAEFQAQLQRMIDLVNKKKVALADAKKSLEDGDLKLEEMKAYWEMSKDAIEANRAAGMDTGDAFEKLKADTACDAVFESMNMAFAQLEVAAALDVDSDDKPAVPVAQLEHSQPVYLDVTVKDVQKVSTK